MKELNTTKLAYITVASTSITAIFILLLFDWLNHAKAATPPDFLKDTVELILIPFLLGIAGSAVAGAFISAGLERSSQRRMFAESEKIAINVAKALKDEFVPNELFGLSNEEDPKFHDVIMHDLGRSDSFHFSGISARVAISRIWDNPDSRGIALIRLPLSDSSIKRAVRIRNNLRRMKPGGSNEFVGVYKDRKRLLELADRDDPQSKRDYINELVNDSILFASHVAEHSGWTIFIQDWDETVEYRIECFEHSLYLGNYHPPGGYSQFSPGTVRFLSTSYLYKLMSESIRNQRLNAESPNTRNVLRLEPKTKTPLDQVTAKIRSLRGGIDLLIDIGPQTGCDRLHKFKEYFDETVGIARKAQTMSKV